MIQHRRIWENDMIQIRNWKRGTALVGLLAAGAAFAQPVGHDFNDDGYSDYPVSIISYDAANPDVGAARIWSGASKAIIHTIVGNDTNTLFGWSTGSAGDLDGDGKDDLIVGEPIWGTPQSQTPTYQGRVQVFSGADASTLLTINGPYIDAAIGRYVTGIGDWDGDGTADIASSGWDVADTDNDGIGDDPIGMVFIFSGADGSLLTEIMDPASSSNFGYAIYSLGDISGDGKADIGIVDQQIETSPGSGVFGQLYIFEGSDAESSYDLTDAYRTISNTDPTIRGYASQVDVMHPDLWHDEPTIQILNLTNLGSGGVNEAEITIDILKVNGVLTGTKGIRPSLTLAGDINLDGKVDAADLQDSISQLGTNPQAIGVMPIADSNKDGVIDLVDIEVVVDGYGATTDIYEGLWDGSRLLGVAAASSGFGSTANVSIRPGGTNFGGGRRPVDDCLRSTTPPGGPTSIIPDLLRNEAANNCNECPDYGAPGSAGCYECDQPGNLTGGEITADPAQPDPDETVKFVIDDVILSGKTYKCKDDCGGEKTHTEDDSPYGFSWEVFRKVDDDSDWVLIDSGSGSPTPSYSGTACSKLKIEVTAGGGNGDCVPDELFKEDEVAFGDYTLKSEMVLEWPSPRTRTDAGPRERVDLLVTPPQPVQWQPSWNAPAEDATYLPGNSGIRVTLPSEPGSYTVTATLNGCEQSKTFTVKAPTGIRVEVIGHRSLAGVADAGQCLKYYVQPESVNFTHIYIREGAGDLNLSTPPAGYTEHSMSHYQGRFPFGHPIGPWVSVASELNLANGTDTSYKYGELINGEYVPGNMSWNIDLNWKVGAGFDPSPEVITGVLPSSGSIDADGNVTVQKGNSPSVTRGLNAGPESCTSDDTQD